LTESTPPGNPPGKIDRGRTPPPPPPKTPPAARRESKEVTDQPRAPFPTPPELHPGAGRGATPTPTTASATDQQKR
jgi:hypothetical protein